MVQACTRPLAPDEARRRARECLNGLPPFSHVLSRLLATIALPDEAISLPQLADAIQMDTIVSGKVLSVANSALYARGQPIYVISHAVARLGLNKVRNLVLGFSITQLWSKTRVHRDFPMDRFNRHSFAVATLAELIAEQVGRRPSDEAFVSGLFHDVGQLLMASIFAVDYVMLLTSSRRPGTLEAIEKEQFGITHSELSSEAVAFWRLPAPVQFAVRFHEDAASAEGVRDYLHLSQIVRAAECYACHLGFAIGERPDNTAASDLAGTLKIDHDALCREFTREMSALPPS